MGHVNAILVNQVTYDFTRCTKNTIATTITTVFRRSGLFRAASLSVKTGVIRPMQTLFTTKNGFTSGSMGTGVLRAIHPTGRAFKPKETTLRQY
jgi:hypothetical protein